jgi:hypothetical protein
MWVSVGSTAGAGGFQVHVFLGYVVFRKEMAREGGVLFLALEL